MANEEMRKRFKQANLYQYQIAKQINISEPQFTRWLRYELEEDKKIQIENAITELSNK